MRASLSWSLKSWRADAVSNNSARRRSTLALVLLMLLPGAAAVASERISPEVPAVDYESADDIGLMARFHFATHTVDFDRARAFYRKLGYTEGISGFPLTNTHQMARALGMYDLCQYELAKGEVVMLPDSPNSGAIDLLQFKTPFNDDPPYELPNHLGMAYAALATTDFPGDVAFLRANGVELLAEPYGEPGQRFVFFRDPDGVLYRLVEAGQSTTTDANRMHVTGMPYIGINVSNLDASLA